MQLQHRPQPITFLNRDASDVSSCRVKDLTDRLHKPQAGRYVGDATTLAERQKDKYASVSARPIDFQEPWSVSAYHI